MWEKIKFVSPRGHVISSIFPPTLNWKSFLYFYYIIAYDISVLEIIGVSITVSAGFFSFCWLVWPFGKRNRCKTYSFIAFIDFNKQHYILYQISALGLFLKIFLKFGKFQPQWSYKIYSYKRKECMYLQLVKTPLQY